MVSRRTARDWSDTRAVSAIAEPTRADVTIIDRTARSHPSHPHPRPGARGNDRLGGSLLGAAPSQRAVWVGAMAHRCSTQRTSAKERDDANKTGHTDRPAGSAEETARRRPPAARSTQQPSRTATPSRRQRRRSSSRRRPPSTRWRRWTTARRSYSRRRARLVGSDRPARLGPVAAHSRRRPRNPFPGT